MTKLPPPVGKPNIKVVAMASAGAAVEWYDFFIYGTAARARFSPKLFFPPELPQFVAQIAAFSTFAVGFIARPIGGMLFGHFGDSAWAQAGAGARHDDDGRRRPTLIGLLPSYATAGILAPLLLVVLRFVQGLAVGGQWGGAALLAIENARGATGGVSTAASSRSACRSVWYWRTPCFCSRVR